MVCEVEHCNQIFATKSEFDRHVSKVHQRKNLNKQWNCEHCGEIFRGKSLFLTNHLIKVHNIDPHTPEERMKRGLLKKRIMVCGYCDRKFTSMLMMKDHVNAIHEKSVTHQCDQCGKTFYRLKSLQVHSKIHTQPPELGMFSNNNCLYQNSQNHLQNLSFFNSVIILGIYEIYYNYIWDILFNIA